MISLMISLICALCISGGALLASVRSVSSAILLILEMNHPLTGLIKVSGAPLVHTLQVLGQ